MAFHSALPRWLTRRNETGRYPTPDYPVRVRRWTTSPWIASLKKMESQLSIVEPVEDVSTEGAHETQGSKVKPGGSRRRRVSMDEGREIARLYAETNTLTSDIRARFGIGESSLYRIVQRQGIPLRGRTSSSKAQVLQPAQVQNARRSRSSNSGQRATSAPRSTAATNTHRASVALPRTPSTGSGASQPGRARQRYRIRFQGERVIEAQDIRDALRQAEVLGAIEITAVARED
jgi:transposase-like protein